MIDSMIPERIDRFTPMRQGLTLLECLVVFAILATMTGLLLSGVQRARSAAARAQCQSQLRQLEMAQHSFLAKHGHFPEGLQHIAKLNNSRGPGLSWPTRILPELEQDAVWREAQEAHSADPGGNAEIHEFVGERAIPLFRCPSDSRILGRSDRHRDWGLLNYLGVAGTGYMNNDGLSHIDLQIRPAAIRDGLSNTIHLGERPSARDGLHGGWYATWGTNFAFGAQFLSVNSRESSFSSGERCVYPELDFYAGRPNSTCDLNHFWSLHPGGANFAFADGSVRFLSYSADSVMPALSTRAGGETAAVPD